MQSTTGANRSQESTRDIPPEPSQFDYNLTIYDSLLPPTSFEWDMANMWMPGFALDPWASLDPMGLPADASIEYGEGFFNEYDDANNTYQQ